MQVGLARRSVPEAPVNPDVHSTFMRLVSDPGNRVVLALGGGALPGLCGNLALLRILEDLGLREYVAEVWGTSAGSVTGAGWASGSEAAAILSRVASLDRRGAIDVCWWRLLSAMLLRPFGRGLPDGIIRGREFARTIDEGLRAKTFEECEIPFRCIACSDDGANTRKVFRRGRLLPAIFASMCIPGIMLPVDPETGETLGYYDGGLVEKTPLISPIAEHNRSGDPRRLVLVATRFGGDPSRTRARGFLNRFVHTMYALEDQLWEHQMEEARTRANVVVLLLNPRLADADLFRFANTLPNYREAYSVLAELLSNARIALTLGAL